MVSGKKFYIVLPRKKMLKQLNLATLVCSYQVGALKGRLQRPHVASLPLCEPDMGDLSTHLPSKAVGLGFRV